MRLPSFLPTFAWLDSVASPLPSASLPALDQLDERHRPPLSREGVPLLKQGDPRWAKRVLEAKKTIKQAGCAITCAAMVLSKLSGKNVSPIDLDRYFDEQKAYKDDGLNWNIAAAFVGADCDYKYDLSGVDQELAAGRPVVCGVDYKRGSNGGAGGTDHWIVLLAKRHDRWGDYYRAVDPMTARVFFMRVRADGTLRAERHDAGGKPVPHRYVSSGQFRSFHLL